MDKIHRIRRLINNLKVDLITLVETKVDESRVNHFSTKFSKHWN